MMISVIILTFNESEYVCRCIEMVKKSRGDFSREIIVIDNGSNDNTDVLLRKRYPEVQLISNHKNLGVARARNQGLRLANGDYMVFLDADSEVRSNTLSSLLSYMEFHSNVAVAGPKLLYPDGTLQYSCRMFPSLLTFICRGLGVSDEHQFLRKHMMVAFNHQAQQTVDWVLGACQMIRRSALKDIGILDEHYFFGYEDIDFCYRAQQKSWMVAYVPSAIAVHHYQRRSARRGLFNLLKWQHSKSALRFFIKRFFS